jgi:23S rRNA (adenine2503-C2)-methyltransferase
VRERLSWGDILQLLEMTYENLVETFAERYGKGSVLAAAVYREFYRNLNPHAWTTDQVKGSPGLADRLERDLIFTPGRIVAEEHQDGVVKLVTELEDRHRIESVILPLKTHHTVCISSQVGCRMGCRFCQTARMGLVRQLTVAEIVGQVYAVRRRFGEGIRNVVFMGMGEPFDNFEAVIQAVRVLSDQRGLDIAQRYITVSTAGRIDGTERLIGENMPHLKLAVSLNAPNDQLRTKLMPINNAAPLEALQKALTAYPLKKGYDIMVAYVLIPGINDGPDCLNQLAEWLASLRAKVNLIPFNPGPDIPYRSPTKDEMEAFRCRLIALHVNVQSRLSRGRDLMAACGQLGGRAAENDCVMGTGVCRSGECR